MFGAYDHDGLVNALTAHDSFVERLYYIEASTIARLRELATSTGGQQLSSRVQALSAYLWKVLATVVATSRVREERCRMLWWVDGRRRITSPELVPAMRSYFGNVTTYVVEEAAVEEIQRKPLAEVAAMVREAITSIDYDEHIQELVDWVEEHKKQKIVERAARRARLADGEPDGVRLVPAGHGLRVWPGHAGHARMAPRQARLRQPGGRYAAWRRRLMDCQRVRVAAASGGARV